MTFEQLSNGAEPFEDHDGQDYINDETGFAIYLSGHYTREELEAKLAQLKDANRFWIA